MDVADNRQLGSPERVTKKLEKIKQIAREAAEASVSQGINQEAEVQLSVANQRAEAAERQARISRGRAEEAEAELRKLGNQWIIQRDEIQVTDVELGRGGWGAVKIANFRGSQFAAKCFYEELNYNFHLQVLHREMQMAARLRHPNMVQFIGASIEGNPIILTELMTTSLRATIEQGPITLTQVKTISLDVTRALNYLHLMKPAAIIHRDISSANVLLDPLPGNMWKAKVSDYGSVNILGHLRTVGPGSPVYAAPEAMTPLLQSPKMDIYSFGVLLIEMIVNQFPDVSVRQRQIASISHDGYQVLIEQCLHENKDYRPSAEEVIVQLDIM